MNQTTTNTEENNKMNELTINNKNQTAQQELLSALADIFNGRQYRYWKKDDELWFVAKDIVEAAGGTWDNGNFRRVVGDGSVQHTPLEINGISQNVLACTAKTAVKWLTLSRLPASEALADRVWEVMDRVMKGEKVNQPKIPQTFAEALRLAADAAEAAEKAERARIEAERLEAIAVAERNKAVGQIQRVTPALLALRSQQQRKESLMVGQFAKELSDDKGYEIGERRLFALLRERGWICKRSSEPTQKAIDHDFMAIKRSTWKHPTRGEQTSIVPLITTRGQIKLHEILTSSGVRKRTQQDILHSEYNDSFESLMCELWE